MQNMKRMGKFAKDPVRKRVNNKDTSGSLVMCGLKKPVRDLGNKYNFRNQENHEMLFDDDFDDEEPMTYDSLESELLKVYDIKDCFVKLTRVNNFDQMMSDSEMDSSHTSENNTRRSNCCHYCDLEFDSFMSKRDHMTEAHKDELTCNVCFKVFKTATWLETHKKTHTAAPGHQCRECKQCFTTTFLLDTHFLSKHAGINPFSCRYCSKEFTLGSALKRHEKSHRKRNGKQTLRCKYCNRFFEEIYHLKKHIRLYHNENKLICKYCGMKFTSHNSLNNHLLTHQDFECSKCGEKFLKKSYLRNHLEIECFKEPENCKENEELPQQPTKKCQICWKQFVTERNLHRHMVAFHSEAERFYCEDCQTNFETEDLLKKHVHIKCRLCDQSFSNIETHMMKAHPADASYNCSVCGAAFSALTRLRTHLKAHSDQFSCEYCFKTFPRSHYLEYHILKKHVVDKSYTCNICEKCYQSADMLREHKKMVHVIDTYECNFCQKVFNKFQLLEMHITKLHAMGTKPMQCDFCPKRFTTASLLKLHEKFHFSSFECITCGNVFKTSECLNKHVKEEHSDEAMKEEPLESDLPRCLCCSRTFKNAECLRKHVDEEHDSCVCSTHNPKPSGNSEGIPIKQEEKETEPGEVMYRAPVVTRAPAPAPAPAHNRHQYFRKSTGNF